MWQAWLQSFPELSLLPLDLGGNAPQRAVRIPFPPLAERLLPPEERALLAALDALAAGRHGECGALCERALSDGLRHPDFHLLAGACALADGRCTLARDLLANAYLYRDGEAGHPSIGTATRHLLPALRLLTRIAPTQLVALYPSPFAAALLYTVALDACGEPEQALMILREMVPAYGMHDEVRIMAARIHIGLGNFETAEGALTHDDCAEQDALEYLRSFYLAYCLSRQDQPRKAAQELGRAVRTIASVNGHTQARARVLLGQLFADCGLLLDSLRESGGVDPKWLPDGVAQELLRQEESVMATLDQLSGRDLERLAEADPFQVYLPDLPALKGLTSKLDIARDPLKNLKSGSMSWVARRDHEEAVAAARSAIAKGEEPPVKFITRLSAAAVDVKKRIDAAHEWWFERLQALHEAPARPELALDNMAETAHLRFDFRGTRELEFHPWLGELRAGQVLRWTGIVLAIAAVLLLLRALFG